MCGCNGYLLYSLSAFFSFTQECDVHSDCETGEGFECRPDDSYPNKKRCQPVPCDNNSKCHHVGPHFECAFDSLCVLKVINVTEKYFF